jgi:hypothetical protein
MSLEASAKREGMNPETRITIVPEQQSLLAQKKSLELSLFARKIRDEENLPQKTVPFLEQGLKELELGPDVNVENINPIQKDQVVLGALKKLTTTPKKFHFCRGCLLAGIKGIGLGTVVLTTGLSCFFIGKGSVSCGGCSNSTSIVSPY